MKKAYKNVLALSLICAIVAVLMAITNFITAPIIKENADKAAQAALAEIMPDGGDFTELDLSEYTLPSTVIAAYKASNGGFVVRLSTRGFADGMVILCGVDENGTVTGAKCLSSNETLSHEKTYGDKFTGLTLEGVNGVDTIASATKTTKAYRAAVVDAINAATILGGGEVDIRDEEEILLDTLKAKLPAADGKFTRLLVSELLDGVKAVYVADNGAGTVYLIGDDAVAITASGEVLGTDVNKTKAEAAAQTLKNSTKTSLDLSTLSLPEEIKAVEKTASGNYIFTIHAKGITYAYPEWYTPTPIVIALAMTEEGYIIDCRTLSQGESEGYGDACEKGSFTDQFSGKSEGDYQKIDGISGSTITTNGYLDGIGKAYTALAILNKTEFVDLSRIATSDSVVSAQKKADGGYLFLLHAKGITYAYPEWYTPTPIVIGLALDAEGKITSCRTIAQGESTGYGDTCMNPSWSNQLNGKTDENFREIDGISGSTITTNGYLDAIDAAYKAFDALTSRTAVNTDGLTLPEAVKAVETDILGNYIFTLHAKGITYDPALSQWYTPTPIVISLTMDKDGKILSCETLSQGESKGYGDACADPSFTGQFSGKTDDSFREIDGISGSTITTNGYLDAIDAAYTVFNQLKGGDGQ